MVVIVECDSGGVVLVVVVPPPPLCHHQSGGSGKIPIIWGIFWHQPGNFDTCTACGACDKYEVWCTVPLCNEFLLPWKDKCTHCSFRIPKPCKMYYVELHCASLNPELRGGSPPQAQPLPLDWPWLRSLPRKDRSNEDDDNDRLGSIWRTNWSPFFKGDGIKLSVSTNFLENYNLFAS